MTSRLSCVVPLLAVMTIACTDSRPRGTATVTDSAGIQIVTSTGPMWTKGQAWRVDTTPLLDVGGNESDPHYDFLEVSGVVRFGDGRLVVLNSGTSEVRYYDSTGHWLASSGRKGKGPGEFEGAGALFGLPGDTLLVYDYQLRRMSRLAPDGAFLPSISLAGVAGGAIVFPFARLADGSWAATVDHFFSTAESGNGVSRPAMAVVHLPPDLGLTADTVVTVPGSEAWVESGGSDGRRFVSVRGLPLGLDSPHAAGDSLIYVGDAAQYVIGAYRPDGTLIRSIRYGISRQPVTAAMLDRVKASELSSMPDRYRAESEAQWEKMPRPKELPAFDAVAVDADGNLWVMEPRVLPADPGSADLFDPAGKLLGKVAIPAGFSPSEIGSDYLLGVWKDDVGVEHVRMYGITKGEPTD